MRGAIVLAGGPGRRMGRPKALVPLAGKPLVTRVVEVARRVADEVVVVTKRPTAPEIRAVVPRGTRVAHDERDVQSPLVGLLTGSRALRSEYVAFLACDLPFLEPRLLADLFERARGADAAIPRWPDGRIEPMAAVYHRGHAKEAAGAALNAGLLANTDMIARLERVRFVPTDELRAADPELDSFVNVNTPEDLAEAERRLAGD